MLDDAPLQALLLPFADGVLSWPPGGALFLNARVGAALRALATPGLVTQQASKPLADALAQAGYARLDDGDIAARRFPLVLLLPPRQRAQARALLAEAVARCTPDGMLVIAAANDAGARTCEADLRQLAGIDGVQSKHHCRVAWVRNDPARIDAALCAQWRALDVSQSIAAAQVPGGAFISRPGVFAWDRIDAASALLAAHLPSDLRGTGADLGAGWGYLSIEALARNRNVAALDLFEADARALALAQQNLTAACATLHVSTTLGFHWHDVAAGLSRAYDFIVTNPPFHAHDARGRPDLGQRFIEVAAQALAPGGRLFLVANRHLPYEAALSRDFDAVRVLAQQDGYKAIEARRSRR